MTTLVSVKTYLEEELDELKSMYFDYIRELLPYEHDNRAGVSDEQSWRMQFAEGCSHSWICEDGRHVGFVFFGPVQLRRHRYWEIIQFYVIPSERRKGIGTKALNALFRLLQRYEWSDRLMYLVLRKSPANAFWNKALSGTEVLKEPEVKPENDEEAWFFRRF